MIVVRIALGRRHKLKHKTVYTYWSICPSCRPPGIPSMFVHVVRSVELEVIGRRVHRIRAVSCRLQKYARSPKDQRSPCGEIRFPRKSSSLVRLISNTTSPRIYSVDINFQAYTPQNRPSENLERPAYGQASASANVLPYDGFMWADIVL